MASLFIIMALEKFFFFFLFFIYFLIVFKKDDKSFSLHNLKIIHILFFNFFYIHSFNDGNILFIVVYLIIDKI